jgi:hypothetical protein
MSAPDRFESTAPECAVPLGTGNGAPPAEAGRDITAHIPAHPLTREDTSPAHSGAHSGAPIPAQAPETFRRTHSGAPACPDCGGAVARDLAGARVCLTRWAGRDFSCGWSQDPILELAPRP